jgi:hypothetical protein
MSDLDDARLRAHLERRGGSNGPPDDLRRAIVNEASSVRQDGRGLLVAPTPRWRLPAFAAVATAAILMFAGVAGVTAPQPSPSAAPPGFKVLSADELTRVTRHVARAELEGRVVIVDGDVEPAGFRCRAGAPCPIGYVTGTNHTIMVWPETKPAYVPDAEREALLPEGPLIEGPLALRFRADGGVELLGPVETLLGDKVVWPFASMVRDAAERPPYLTIGGLRIDGGPDGVLAGGLYLVDAWLVESPFAPPCPAPPEGLPASVAPFTCGIAAWLTPEDVDPSQFQAPSDSPSGALRIQNDSYDAFAPDPARSGPSDTPEPRRALYLVRSTIDFPPDACSLCAGGKPAYLVARVDPIDVPPEPSTASPDLTILTAAQLAGVVAQVPTEAWRNRVVIVDTDIEVVVAFCAFQDPVACPIGFVAGTDPRLPIWPDPASAYGDDAYVDWYRSQDVLPGPFALRLGEAGRVELIGPVETLLGDRVAWPLGSMLTEVDRWRSVGRTVGADGVAVGPLFVVDAWLVEMPVPECPVPAVQGSAAITPFRCGEAAWLTAEEFQPTTIESSGDMTSITTSVPPRAVRVQNGAYDVHAPNPARIGDYRLPEPRRALYLVRSILDFPNDACFMCNAAGQAYLIARLDPVEVPPVAEN